MSARARVLFVMLGIALVGVVQSLEPPPSAAASVGLRCAPLGQPLAVAQMPRPCDTPWASCWARASTAIR
jgi:hypothetical protein